MKKYLSFFFLVSAVIGFAACSNDDDDLDKYQDWKIENEQFIDKIIASGEYTALESSGGYGAIYYKVLEEGNNEEKVDVFFNSTVSVYYALYTIDDTAIQVRMEEDGEPVELFMGGSTVAGSRSVIEGFGTAVENMQPGDKWEFWIPWPLAYGSTGSRQTTGGAYIVLPYSALRYIVKFNHVVN